jgi:hypothetical protein
MSATNCGWCGAALGRGETEVCTGCLSSGLPYGFFTRIAALFVRGSR